MRYVQQPLGVVVLVLLTVAAPAFAQIPQGIPVYPYGVYPGGVTPLRPDPAQFANPNFPYVIPGTVPPWTLPSSVDPYANPAYTQTLPVPAPVVPNPIVPRPIVPNSPVPNVNVTPNGPQGPGFLNPNVYGTPPIGSAPPAVIWGSEAVRPFWFNPRFP